MATEEAQSWLRGVQVVGISASAVAAEEEGMGSSVHFTESLPRIGTSMPTNFDRSTSELLSIMAKP